MGYVAGRRESEKLSNLAPSVSDSLPFHTTRGDYGAIPLGHCSACCSPEPLALILIPYHPSTFSAAVLSSARAPPASSLPPPPPPQEVHAGEGRRSVRGGSLPDLVPHRRGVRIHLIPRSAPLAPRQVRPLRLASRVVYPPPPSSCVSLTLYTHS